MWLVTPASVEAPAAMVAAGEEAWETDNVALTYSWESCFDSNEGPEGKPLVIDLGNTPGSVQQ